MRWATFQIPPATRERIGVVRGDEIHAMAAGPRLIDLLGDGGERLAAAGAKTLASPAEVVRVDRVRLLPPISRPPAVRDFMTFRQHIETIRKSQGLELPKQFFEIPVFYFTNPHALVGAHDPVPMPPGCQNLDFECEIGGSSRTRSTRSTSAGDASVLAPAAASRSPSSPSRSISLGPAAIA